MPSTLEIDIGSDDEATIIGDRLDAFNRKNLGFNPKQNLNTAFHYVVKDQGKLIAGINAYLYLLEVLFVSVLFVDEDYRSKGLGTVLLNKVETEAKIAGAKVAHLDAFDWQGKDFYIKHGYEVFGVNEGCPPGHKYYFLKKRL